MFVLIIDKIEADGVCDIPECTNHAMFCMRTTGTNEEEHAHCCQKHRNSVILTMCDEQETKLH